MKKLNYVMMGFVFILLLSCSSDSGDDPGNIPPVNNDVTYSKNVKPIIDSRCLSCHSNPPVNNAPMSLVTYQNVRDAVLNRDLIAQVESGAMPPSGANLSSSQVKTIKDWQSGGFKE